MPNRQKTPREIAEEMGKITKETKPGVEDDPSNDQNPPEVPNKNMDSQKEQESNRIHTWVEVDDNKYISAGRTTSELPPGSYNIAVHDGNTAFKKIDLTPEDNLVRGEDTFIDQSLKEIDKFWGDDVRNMYQKYGYLHKRGYMFYGKHGCGKTSIAMTAVQNFLHQFSHGYVILPGHFPEKLNEAVTLIRKGHPDSPILCYLEDLETITRDEENRQEISNLLDGGHNVDRILFLSTSNHPEKLDPKFLRARRFDKIIKVPPPEEAIRREYLYSLARQGDGEVEEDKLEEIVSKTDGYTFSSLSELFISCICLGHEVDDILTRLQMIEEGKFRADDDKQIGFPK